MAQGKGSDARYILETAATVLAKISRGEGYLVDVAKVYRPAYAPLAPAMFEAESFSLHVWAMDSPSAGGDWVGKPRRTLSLWVGGFFRGDVNVQETLLDFGESIRGVMLFQLVPALPPAMGAFVLEEAEGIGYQIDKSDAGFLGQFLSKWGVQYDFASPTG